ncbi:MAG: M4 family metallopeptidase [Bryobacteraceae bacterium]|nr:M4 family metallopeptidase [Bryobacteraceae bacterium]
MTPILILLALFAPFVVTGQVPGSLVEDVNREALRLSGSDQTTFHLRRSTTDERGTVHARFEQRYAGLRVPGGEIIAHIPRDGERTLTAKVFPYIRLDTRSAMSKGAALSIAARAWATSPQNLSGREVQAELVVQPLHQLSLFGNPEDGTATYDWRAWSYRLAWRFEASPGAAGPKVVFVDAQSGAMQSWDAVDYNIVQPPAPPNATARTYWFGTQSINTRFNATTQAWELIDPVRGNSAVRDSVYSEVRKAFPALLYSNVNNSWGDFKAYTAINGTSSPNGQTAAVDVAFAVRNTWDMFLNVFKRAGLNGAGKAIEARVHWGKSFGDAFWVNSEQTAFFGDGAGGGESITRTDQQTVGHELGHGFWFYELGPDGGLGTESDGLNEGHGDITASLAEMYQRTGGTGPLLPEQTSNWNWLDRMVNPLNYNWDLKDSEGKVIGSSTGYRYYSPGIGKAEEHANGCLYGHFFVLLARGSSPDPANPLYSKFRPKGTNGIGVMKAARIWYLATTAYMPPEPSYVDARSAYLNAAKDLFGAQSSEHAGVQQAWAAIGLSTQPGDKVVLKF